MKITLRLAFVVGLLVSAVARGQKAELIVETGHADVVTSVAFSPDGRILASGSQDDTIKLWDVASGRELRTLAGHTYWVTSVVFSPDGRILASGSDDNTIKLWDVASGRELRTLSGHSQGVNSVAFSPDGRSLASASDDETIKLWDVTSGRELGTLAGHTSLVQSVTFSPDGRTLASGSWDHTIKLWDVATKRELRTLEEHTTRAPSVAFSPNGRTLASGIGHTVVLWDVANGRELRTLTGNTDSVNSVAFSPDGRTVASGGDDRTIRLWDVASGRELRTLTGHHTVVDSVAFSPDSRTVASGSADKTAKLWSVFSGRELHTLAGHISDVYSVAVSPDSRTLGSGSGDTIKLWDVSSGREVGTLGGTAAIVGMANAIAFSPDSRTLASSDGQSIQLWNVATRGELGAVSGPMTAVQSVAFGPDGRSLATSWEDAIKLWEIPSGRELCTLAANQYAVSSVAFNPDGRTLVSGGWDGTIKLWDVAKRSQLRTIVYGKSKIESVAFSPEGGTLASASSDGAVKLWDAASGRELRAFAGHPGARAISVAFSPDARIVASGGGDGTIKLWDAASGRELHTLAGHTRVVSSVTFSPDGRLVLSASPDASVRIWDAASGNELATLYSFGRETWVVADPFGRFDTNDLDGGAPLHWLVSDEPVRPLPLEVFMRDYYTPRLLTRIMNHETLPPVRSIAEITNRVQPEVAVVSITASKTKPGRAEVVVHAASHTSEKGQASGLQDLRLFRDGQLVGYRQGELTNGDFSFSGIQLPTTAKSVTFTAYAFNSERIKSATAQKEYAYVPGPAAKPRAWLLQIGVNHYEASGCELHGSANDAQDLSKILAERLTARGLDVRPVVLVSTEQTNDATKAKVRDALARIASQATPDDVFFLSFSGHGYSNQNGQFYILPSDAQGTCAGVTPQMLRTAISADELTQWLRPIDAGQMTFIIDACDSASSVESNDFKPGPMGSPGLGQLAYDKRMRILAASQPNQAARESATLGRGLLSYALTELGLVEGQADWKPKDGKITVGEWLGYGADEVPKFVQSGAVKGGRGVFVVGAPEKEVPSAQTPAVFDFSKSDAFVLQ